MNSIAPVSDSNVTPSFTLKRAMKYCTLQIVNSIALFTFSVLFVSIAVHSLLWGIVSFAIYLIALASICFILALLTIINSKALPIAIHSQLENQTTQTQEQTELLSITLRNVNSLLEKSTLSFKELANIYDLLEQFGDTLKYSLKTITSSSQIISLQSTKNLKTTTNLAEVRNLLVTLFEQLEPIKALYEASDSLQKFQKDQMSMLKEMKSIPYTLEEIEETFKNSEELYQQQGAQISLLQASIKRLETLDLLLHKSLYSFLEVEVSMKTHLSLLRRHAEASLKNKHQEELSLTQQAFQNTLENLEKMQRSHSS